MPCSLRGTLETLLVVDDDEEVLKVEETDGVINLLLSDVDMVQMPGPELGELLKKTRPDIHVMLMSGGERGSLLVLNHTTAGPIFRNQWRPPSWFK